MTGKVKWFDANRGYGFITDTEGNDVFVHYCGLNMVGFKALQNGQTVEFDVIETEKGRQAMNVSSIDTDYIVDQEEICQYIKNQLGDESKLTLEDIDTVLNLEMDFLKSKGIVD